MMMQTKAEFEAFKKMCYAALIADVLDELGYPDQSFGPGYAPVVPTMKVFGRAYPVIMEDVFEHVETPLVNQCKAIDDVKENDVYVLKCLGECKAGNYGEILSTGIRARGGLGAIVEGYSRDTAQIIEMDFPVISKGFLPTTAKQRCEIRAWNVPVKIDGIKVNPGDLIYGDIDGVVVIPKEVEETCVKRCYELETTENTTKEKIRNGWKLLDAFFDGGAL